jgi:hypothetical protein
MDDLNDILRELERRYPKWLVTGLSASPEIKSIEKSLASLSGTASSSSKSFKETSKASKDLHKSFTNLGGNLDDFDKVIGKTSDSFDDILKSTDELARAQSSLSKKLLGNVGKVLGSDPAQQLFKGRFGAAAESLGSELSYAAKSLKGFTGIAVGAVGLLSEAISRAVEVIFENNAAYVKLAQSGFRINDAFTGVSKAAINANLSLEDFTELAVKNASTLALWGASGAKDLGLLSKNIRFNRDEMGRFGFDISEVNEYLTDYLEVQKTLGFLNKRTQLDFNAGFKDFITDAAEFSNLLGYSRKQIIETATSLAEAPQWGFFIRSLGDGGKVVQDAFNRAALTLSSIEGPKLGGQLASLMQDIISFGGPVHDETRALVTNLQATNPLLLKQVYMYSDNIKHGNQAAASSEEMAKQLIQANSGFSNQNALIMEANNLMPGFSDGVNEANGRITDLTDKAKQTTGGLDGLLQQMKLADTENAKTAGTFALFDETIQAVKLTFETGLISVIDANRASLISFADTIGRDVLPMVLEFTDYLKGFMDPSTRAQMIDDIEGSIGYVIKGVFHKMFPWLVGAPTAPKSSAGPSMMPGSGAIGPHSEMGPKKMPTVTGSLGMGTGVAPTPTATGGKYDAIINAAAAKYGIRPELLKAQMMKESHGVGGQTSPKGAEGLMQFMPRTAAQYGVDVNDPTSSIFGAAHYMSDLLNQYGGSESAALAAYNEGPGNYNKGRMPAETKDYVSTIMSKANNSFMPATASMKTTTSPSPVPVVAPSTSGGTTPTTASSSGDSVVSLLTTQVKQLQEAVDKLTVIAVNTDTHNDKLRKMTRAFEQNYTSNI